MENIIVGVIGAGFVGGAVVAAHEAIGDTVLIKDPRLGDKSASYDDLSVCDAIFIAVPSLSCDDGSCDVSILETVLEELANNKELNNISWISKSTAPPSFYERMSKKYKNLVYVPEFLTAVNANEDYRNTDFLIVGGSHPWHKENTQDIIQPTVNIQKKDIKIRTMYTDAKTASMVKYMLNTYLATKVTLMNEYKLLCDQLNIDWGEIVPMITRDGRIGSTHVSVPGPDGNYGYGGACFPKDTAALIHEAMEQCIKLSVIETSFETNKTLRKG